MTDAWDGRPANPERDGDHWVSDANSDVVTAHWNAEIQCWGAWPYTSAAHMAENNSYLGPCLTPAEVAAQRDAAWRAGRDAAASYVEPTASDNGATDIDRRTCAAIAAAIRALQPPADLAAAAATCDAVAVEREAIAADLDCGCPIRDAVLDRLQTQDERRASYLCGAGSSCCALTAAAIRARGRAGA